MPMSRAETIAWQAARKLRLRGSPLTLRRPLLTDDLVALQNPPVIDGPLTVATDTAAGATSITLVAPSIDGFVAADDQFVLDGVPNSVTSAAKINADTAAVVNNEPFGRLVIPLTAPLSHTVAAGAGVTPIWAADLHIMGKVDAGPRSLADGTALEQADMIVTVAAFDLPQEPSTRWVVILGPGQEYTVVSFTPELIDGIPALYDLVARRK
jgi:hypothetical protein